MTAQIHSTAIVDPKAIIGSDVLIGPYCIVGEHVKIGNGTRLISHVVVEGDTDIGERNEIHQFSSIGVPPQDKSYKNERTQTIIGNENLFRENCTIHRATLKQDKRTIVGSNGFFMTGVHFAHDCHIGDFVTMANQTMCAGHVRVGDYVQMGGASGVTPFCSIGRGAFIGAASAIDRDIPPFFTAFGNRIKLKGVNIVGMKRRGFSKESISEALEFYRMMESSALSPRAFVKSPENVSEYRDNSVIKEIVDAIISSEVGLPPFMS